VEARALATTNTFTIEGDCELPQSSSKRNVDEWVVCLVVRGTYNYGHDSFARSQSSYGNPYEHGNNRNFMQ
jgi:hypothetical protein